MQPNNMHLMQISDSNQSTPPKWSLPSQHGDDDEDTSCEEPAEKVRIIQNVNSADRASTTVQGARNRRLERVTVRQDGRLPSSIYSPAKYVARMD